MLIKLKDLNGKVTQEVDVDDAFGEWYVEEERKEENDARRYRYWETTHLDGLDYEGAWFEDKESESPEDYVERLEQEARYDAFLKTLTTTQLRRLHLLEDETLSMRDVARIEGVDIKSIHKTREQLKKKYLAFFKDDPHQKR